MPNWHFITVQTGIFLDIQMLFGASTGVPLFVRAGDAVSKQSKMKMMLTVKAYLEVMMLHQIGRK